MDKRRRDKREFYNRLDTLPKEEVEKITEHFKERIYATITLIALLATLWQAADHFTHRGAAFSVLGTSVALWLAIAVSSRMSYQFVNGKRMGPKAYADILRSHAVLLTLAFPVLILIGVSALGVFSLKTALLVSLIIMLWSFVGFSLLAGRRIHSSFMEILVTSAFEIALGIGIIALKIFAGH